jgi:hypothetical protein
MTIREFVIAQEPMGINEWLNLIHSNGFGEQETLIIMCAEEYDLITVDYTARFDRTCINI